MKIAALVEEICENKAIYLCKYLESIPIIQACNDLSSDGLDSNYSTAINLTDCVQITSVSTYLELIIREYA